MTNKGLMSKKSLDLGWNSITCEVVLSYTI